MNIPESVNVDVQYAQEWSALIQDTADDCLRDVSRCVQQNAVALSDSFYQHMLAHPEARNFLTHAVVNQQLHASMARWLTEVFEHPMRNLQAQVAVQRHLGEVHARFHLPVHLIARGMRTLKVRLHQFIAECLPGPSEAIQAASYTSQVLDIAFELISSAYMRNTERDFRTDEAYRLYTLGHNIAVERERQRAHLSEWFQQMLLALHGSHVRLGLASLQASEFGLWFTHKARTIFDGAPEIEFIGDGISRIDDHYAMLRQSGMHGDSLANHLASLQNEVDTVKFHLASLFERYVLMENERDSLTRLLNRRFLPAVLNREMQLIKHSGGNFALLLLDIDNFKSINDSHGHEAGDRVLQQAASLISYCVRGGDFVFRYGGEELLVLLVEVDVDAARQIAEKIRLTFQAKEFLVTSGHSQQITLSIGLAMFDGHPDYQYLIRRADQAMYQAKNSGRNRVCEA